MSDDATADFKRRLFFCGVGGLGTLMTAEIVAQAAVAEGLPVVTAEVHGASQRGGSVNTTVVIGSANSPLVPDGRADYLVALEPLEALRCREKIGPKTTVICNTEPIVPVTVTMGGPDYPALDSIRDLLDRRAGRLVWFNATEVAREAGLDKAANAALLGALTSLGSFPVSSDAVRETLRARVPDRYWNPNLAAFQSAR